MVDTIIAEANAVKDVENDTVFAFFAKRTMEMVLAYLEREDLPDGLIGVCAEIALERYEDYMLQEESGGVKSITQGEMDITLFDQSDKTVADILEQYVWELNRYKKVVW
ncbi:hypothetical protein [Chakrabartyella piscis]|uniref:hypothetical protein n=1 Tax=Chakrabartyella piscis TaxID=2918914 RepID=UPI0029585E4E|nr:hypothetical protein [Chakrabartyella piscis]